MTDQPPAELYDSTPESRGYDPDLQSASYEDPDQDFDPELDRCPRESDGQHRWHYDEPPEWMDVSEWDDAAWGDWYDQANAMCYSCGETRDG